MSTWNKNNNFKLPNGTTAYTFRLNETLPTNLLRDAENLIILKDTWTEYVYSVECPTYEISERIVEKNIDNAKKKALKIVFDYLTKEVNKIVNIQMNILNLLN